MKRRRLTFFVFTAVVAFVTAMLVHGALKRMQGRVAALQQNLVRVVAAAHALSPGRVVNDADLKLISWPRDQLPPGALTDLQAALGKIVKESLSINQPIVASALLDSEQAAGVLPLLIPKGMRAISIPVDDVSDMAGFVLPHARVDVLVSIGGGGAGGGGAGAAADFTRIVLQNIEVVAVAQILGGSPDKPQLAKVVTLLVTPEDAERLAAASRLGTLGLAMRNYGDQEYLATAGVSSAALLGIAPPPPLQTRDHRIATRPNRGREVEVIRNGTEHQRVDFLPGGRIRVPTARAPPPAAASAAPAP